MFYLSGTYINHANSIKPTTCQLGTGQAFFKVFAY